MPRELAVDTPIPGGASPVRSGGSAPIEATTSAEAEEAVPVMRCADSRPHGPHLVAPHGERTGFTCAGHPSAAELERLLDEAFGS